MALLDSGASGNYIRKTLKCNQKVDDLGYRAYLGKKHVQLPDERKISALRVQFDCVNLRGNTFWNTEFFVMDKLIHDVILGSKFLQELGAILNLKEDKMEI